MIRCRTLAALVLSLLVVPAGAGAHARSPRRAVFAVTNTNDSGAGSLRQAILNANAAGGSNTLTFGGLAGVAPFTITLSTPLPSVSSPLAIDGTSAPGWSGTPVVVLDGSLITGYSNGILIAWGGCAVKGLVIQGFSGAGIFFDIPVVALGTGSCLIAGNYIGTNAAGTAAVPNGSGVAVSYGVVIIDGTTLAGRNVISGNAQAGIYLLYPGCVVRGNYIGLNAAGTAAVGNSLAYDFSGIDIRTSNTVIGGSGAGEGNVISGNGGTFGAGIHIRPDPVPTGLSVAVQGNWIRTDASGTAAVPNGFGMVDEGVDSLIGGDRKSVV